MPYSCTSVLRDGPIYINASVISVLFPDAMSRTLGSEGEDTQAVPLSSTTQRVHNDITLDKKKRTQRNNIIVKNMLINSEEL